MTPEDVTVIVPTKNEERNITALLASLPPECHLIVIDAGTDRTAERVSELRPERSRILSKASTIPEARQAGAELAGTPWLLFTDADVVFPPGYFGVLAAHGHLDSVYGTKLSGNEFRRFYGWFALGQRLCDWIGIPAVSGSNLAVRTDVLRAVGGFDPDLVCNEDSELGWRIKRAGYRIRFAPGLTVFATDHRRLQRGVLKKILHSTFRCLLLYLNLVPARWRRHDWGYWDAPETPQALDDKTRSGCEQA